MEAWTDLMGWGKTPLQKVYKEKDKVSWSGGEQSEQEQQQCAWGTAQQEQKCQTKRAMHQGVLGYQLFRPPQAASASQHTYAAWEQGVTCSTGESSNFLLVWK